MNKRFTRSLLAMLLAAALVFASVPAVAENLYMYVNTGNPGKLHLRALPTTDSQSLGLFPNGTPVLVESISYNWAFVQVNGQRGYMALNCLSAAAPAVPYTPVPAVTPVPTEDTTLYVCTGNSGKLHLREYASQSARSLGLYPNGTAVRVTSRNGAWAFVTVAGVSGYMMLRYLSAVAPAQPVTPAPTVNPGTAQLMYIQTGNSGKLHLREYPSQSAGSLGLFPNGTPVYAVNLGNGWCQAVVNGKSGYMMTRYLVLSGGSVTPAPTASPVPVPPGATLCYVATGNSGRLHLRENMSADSASLGLFSNGTPVYVIQNYGVWSYVNVSGQQGYMMNQFLTIYQPAAPTATPAPGVPGTATVRQPNNSFVYLRSSESSSDLSNVICQVPSGTVVTVISWGQWWSLIQYNDVQGYMVTHYLK